MDTVAVHGHRPVRAHPALSARRVHITVAPAFCCSVMIDHAVNDACRNEVPEFGASETLEVIAGMPVRQAEHGDLIPCLLQNA